MWNRGHGVGVLMQDGSNMSRITRRGGRDALTLVARAIARPIRNPIRR